MIKNRNLFILLVVFFTIILGCNTKKTDIADNISSDSSIVNIPESTMETSNDTFPKVKNLNEFKQTEFLPTLEHEMPADKNAVYSASLLFAWDEIRKSINESMKISDSYPSLSLLNKSTSFKNVLHKNEFMASGEVEGEFIRANAVFSKSLPYQFTLTSFTDNLIFDGKKVASFGNIGYEERNPGTIQILYYKNDDNFIIKLLPKDNAHEIILFKSSETYKSMAKILTSIEQQIEIGKKESSSINTEWKYYLTPEDELVVPKLKFNIEHNYTNLEGNKVATKNRDYIINTAYQRNAFILDEGGAVIESEAYIDTAAAPSDIELPKPKKMRFDKPFFLMMKRTDNKNPYFGLYIQNTELMLLE